MPRWSMAMSVATPHEVFERDQHDEIQQFDRRRRAPVKERARTPRNDRRRTHLEPVDDQDSHRANSMSDTVSCAQWERRQRLRLVLNAEMPAASAGQHDSQDQGFNRVRQAIQHERRCVRVAAESTRLLAEREGPGDTEMTPRAIRRHLWSALTRHHQLTGNNLRCNGCWRFLRAVDRSAAAAICWEASRDALHSRKIPSRDDSVEWIHPGSQERLLNLAIAEGARGSRFGVSVREINVF